jgi:phosphatidate cytidylyltransferase
MLRVRVISAVVFIFLALVAINLGQWWFPGALALLVLLGQWEYFQMVRAKGSTPAMKMTMIISVTLIFIQKQFPLSVGEAFGFGGAAIFFYLLFRPKQATINDIATSMLGLFYGGFLPSYWVRLRDMEQGLAILFITFACIWAADIGAYFFGKAYGKTRLYPRISPKKTVEGAAFGVGSSVLVGFLGALYLNWWPLAGIFFGLLIGVTALLGDLTESLMKRDAGLKDSGDLIPGHGGVMDRTDSYVFTAPMAFYFVTVLALLQR